MTLEIWRLEMEIGDDFLFSIFYFWPEEPAAPVLTLRCGGTMCSELFIIKKEKDDDSGVISNLASTHLRGRRSQARVVVFLRRVSAESVRSGPSLLGAAPPRAVARIAQRVGRRG